MALDGISRRYFFYSALFAGAIPAGGFGSVPSLTRLGYKSPNDKLNLATIGAGGRGYVDLRYSAAGVENIVALADADFARGEQGFAAWPKAERFKDFRQMLDKKGKEIDAVTIASSDHMHATHALACMRAGKHVYVEKPLTRTTWESLLLRDAAAKYHVATQMGNQGYSHDATRVACEIIWSGDIGDVTEVHAWSGKPEWPLGMQKVPPPTPAPDTLDWDVWLGGAAWRPYTAGDAEYKALIAPYVAGTTGAAAIRRAYVGFYCPFVWRGFCDFGTGHFGDWGLHIMGPANWALQLSLDSLISVEATKREGLSPITYPQKSAVKFEFGPRGSMPPVTVYWEDNVQGDAYLPPGMSAEQARKIPGTGPQVGPTFDRQSAMGGGGGRGATRSGYNCIMVGTKGYLGTNGRGEEVGLLPGSRWAEYKLPNAYLARSPGPSPGTNSVDWDIAAHTHDWVRACKGGAPACSNFSIAGPFAAWVLLGAVASHYEGKLLWDNARMQFSNNKEATKWIRPTFRKGWDLKL